MRSRFTLQELLQRVYRSDGTWSDRFADTYTFHATHAHFHYNSFGQSFLYRANEDGTKGELIRVGWADVYNWFLADQYIEISVVEPGLYVLETDADPNETVLETTRDDNAASVLIRLDDDSVEIVEAG